MFKKKLLLLSLSAVIAGTGFFGVTNFNAEAAVKKGDVTIQPVTPVPFQEVQLSLPSSYFNLKTTKNLQKVYKVKKEGSNYVIPILLGQRPNKGFVLDTVSVHKSNNTVFIKVREIKPDARKMIQPVLTYPTSVITIPASEVGATPVFVVKDSYGMSYKNITGLEPIPVQPQPVISPNDAVILKAKSIYNEVRTKTKSGKRAQEEAVRYLKLQTKVVKKAVVSNEDILVNFQNGQTKLIDLPK